MSKLHRHKLSRVVRKREGSIICPARNPLGSLLRSGAGAGNEICRDSNADLYSTGPLIVGDIRIYQAKDSNLEVDNEARGCLPCAEITVWIGAERFPLQLPLPLQIFNPKPMTL